METKELKTEVLILPLGWSLEEKNFLPRLFELADLYVYRYGFYVFQKDEEFAAFVSKETNLAVSLNSARLLLLHSLSHSMMELGYVVRLSDDICEENIDCYLTEFLKYEKNKDKTISTIRSLWNQLLGFCGKNSKQVIEVIKKFYESELRVQDFHIESGSKGWNVIVLLEKKTRLYVAHIFVENPSEHSWSQRERQVCNMIGIRQSFANALLRDKQCKEFVSKKQAIDQIAKRLLTQVAKFCKEKKGNEIFVPQPFGIMPSLLKSCGFSRVSGSSYEARIDQILRDCIIEHG